MLATVALTLSLLTPTISPGYRVARDTVLGGTHWRLVTPHGVVHVWRPRLYRRPTAGILIYIHGYYSNTDQAWTEYHLAKRFQDSKQNALFIVPEAPRSAQEPVAWRDLSELLKTVSQMTHRRPPPGPVSVLAFSGGFRTVVEWLASDQLVQIILLDALYENESAFATWLQQKSAQMILVASETAPKADLFVRRFPQAATRSVLPDHAFELSLPERNAKVLYMRTSIEHMALATGAQAVPVLLDLTPFTRLLSPPDLSAQ